MLQLLPKVSKIGYGTKIFLLCAKKIAQTIATVIRAPEGSKDMYIVQTQNFLS